MTYYVRMTDKFMSGWGGAEGKTSVLVVECPTYEMAEQIHNRAELREEMRRIAIVDTKPRERSGTQTTYRHWLDMGGEWKRGWTSGQEARNKIHDGAILKHEDTGAVVKLSRRPGVDGFTYPVEFGGTVYLARSEAVANFSDPRWVLVREA